MVGDSVNSVDNGYGKYLYTTMNIHELIAVYEPERLPKSRLNQITSTCQKLYGFACFETYRLNIMKLWGFSPGFNFNH